MTSSLPPPPGSRPATSSSLPPPPPPPPPQPTRGEQGRFSNRPASRYPSWLTWGLGDFWIAGWIVLLAVLAALFIPVAEEIVYRGLLWSALEKRGMREEAILLLTSLVFAAAHLEPARFPILFVLGLVLGFGRVRTGRIGSCIAAHIYLNSTAMIALLATL